VTDVNGATTPGRTRRRAPSAQERQRDPERTKAQILDAAVDVFSAKGFAGARVAEIAKQAGVNQQLITYYFGGKEGLYREIGRRWRDHEDRAYADDLPLAAAVKRYVLDAADPHRGGKLLAWQGLADTGTDDPDATERTARLRHEVAVLRRQQQAGDLDPELDPAALLLIAMSAGTALLVYPQIARGLFDTDDVGNPELVEHYADQLAKVIAKLSAGPAAETDPQATPGPLSPRPGDR
jgi:AcrR family transcriptional regulator